jgi:C-terminal processing protease CtpA/Prc
MECPQARLDRSRREIEAKPEPRRADPPAPAPASTGETVGVGIRLTDEPPHRVVEVVAGGSAALAGGIQAGDLLISVAGKDIAQMPMSSIRRLLVGPVGSVVAISFLRDGASSGAGSGEGTRFTVSLTRSAPVKAAPSRPSLPF